MIHYTNCPACSSANINAVLTATDQTVSKQKFAIWQCNDCTLRFTQDVPSQNEIGPYYKSEDYISHTNTSKGLINSLYQFVRKTTLKQKRKLVNKTTGKQTGNLLDLGSGVGAFAGEMKTVGWNVTGLEPDDDARKVAADIYKIELKGTDQLFQLPAESFDAVTMWHVLEHVHDLHEYIRQLHTLLKNDGKLIIAVPNYTSLDGDIYKEYWAAYDVPRHLYHFSPKSMQLLMGKNGFSVAQYKPMWFDSFYICLLSSKYKNGKTNWIAAAWNGFRSNLKALSNSKNCSSVIYVIEKK